MLGVAPFNTGLSGSRFGSAVLPFISFLLLWLVLLIRAVIEFHDYNSIFDSMYIISRILFFFLKTFILKEGFD